MKYYQLNMNSETKKFHSKSENLEGEQEFNENDVSVASITIKNSPKNLLTRPLKFKKDAVNAGSKSQVLSTPRMLDI
jgi:hypothetical protein